MCAVLLAFSFLAELSFFSFGSDPVVVIGFLSTRLFVVSLYENLYRSISFFLVADVSTVKRYIV